MAQITLADPAWRTTFPHRVTPISDEWLPGMILRCDEANHWGCGTTLAHLLHASARPSTLPPLYWTLPLSLDLDSLAQVLAVSREILVSTTYQPELVRLFGRSYIHPAQLSPTIWLRVCPECMKHQRLLRRTLILPHIMCCLLHHVMLIHTCPCGGTLHLFIRNTQPFTCYKCGLDWAEFPCIQASPEQIAFEQRCLSYYEFFLFKGTPTLVKRTLRYIHEDMKNKRRSGVQLFDGAQTFFVNYVERVSLGKLVHVLMSLDLSLESLVAYLDNEVQDEI